MGRVVVSVVLKLVTNDWECGHHLLGKNEISEDSTMQRRRGYKQSKRVAFAAITLKHCSVRFYVLD